jgi:error-prone DNA polymerase
LPRHHRGRPDKNEVLFERFLSNERDEPPDIDVDFEHERREEIIQWIYEQGPHARRAGRHGDRLPQPQRHPRGRQGARPLARHVGVMADTVWGSGGSGVDLRHVREAGSIPAIRGCAGARAVGDAVRLPAPSVAACRRLRADRGRLDELVPIQNAAMEDRTVIEWDKDDLDALRSTRSTCWRSAC